MENKVPLPRLTKKKKIIFVILSLILTLIPFVLFDRIESADSISNPFFSWLFNAVETVYRYIVYGWASLLANSSNVQSENSESLGWTALELSPFIGTIIFSFVFYIITWIRRKIFYTRYGFVDWILPVFLFFVLGLTYLGTMSIFSDPVDRCLSGELAYAGAQNSSGVSISLPDECFKTILSQKEEQLQQGGSNQTIVEWCNSLSNTKIVFGSNIDFASYASYRDYCLNAIGEKTLEPNPMFSNNISNQSSTQATTSLQMIVYPDNYPNPQENISLSTIRSMSANVSGDLNLVTIDPNINDTNYPLKGVQGLATTTTNFKLVYFNKDASWNDINAQISSLGYKSATVRELIPFAISYYNSKWSNVIAVYDPSATAVNGAIRIPVLQRVNGEPDITLTTSASDELPSADWVLVTPLH